MKELTLINRYHQIQERPKPPVEQRVKVMDTLDKKMQTILEREDMSADERLIVVPWPSLFLVRFPKFVVDQVLFHEFRYDYHGSGSVIVVDVQISSERLVV
jgi:hypothetical protein